MKKGLFALTLLLVLALPTFAQEKKQLKKKRPAIVRVFSKLGKAALVPVRLVASVLLYVYVTSDKP